VEKVKSFLVGGWMGRNLLVLPSLNFLTEGVDVMQEGLLSPFLQQDLSGFKAYGVEGEDVLYFGYIDSILEKIL
jgi:metallophosphoesterase superfamily enzyme